MAVCAEPSSDRRKYLLLLGSKPHVSDTVFAHCHWLYWNSDDHSTRQHAPYLTRSISWRGIRWRRWYLLPGGAPDSVLLLTFGFLIGVQRKVWFSRLGSFLQFRRSYNSNYHTVTSFQSQQMRRSKNECRRKKCRKIKAEDSCCRIERRRTCISSKIPRCPHLRSSLPYSQLLSVSV